MKKIFQKLIILTLFASVTGLSYIFADNPVIMKINGKEVFASDFIYIYDKYHTNSQNQQMTVQEYVPMYLNFRLKIEETLAEELDTIATFKKELAGYRNQLSKQYLDPVRYAESVVRSVYDQSQEVVEISRILIKVPEKSFPADTLAAYKRAMQVYNRLEKEPFDKVALETSDELDNTDTPAYWGWIYSTSVSNKQPADIAYATPVGKYSLPTRAPQGYYIIKVHNRKPNPGERLASHILLVVNENNDDASVKSKIDSIYALLKNGADFAELATQYSDDKNSAVKGGELPWFGVKSMVTEFEQEAYALTTPGEYSAPFRSRYGYHIVKLLDQRPFPPPYDEVKESLAKYMMRIDRSSDIKAVHLDILKEAYDYKLFEEAYNRLITLSNTYFPTDSLFAAKAAENSTPLFAIGDSTFTENGILKILWFPSYYTFSEDIIADKLKAHVYELLQKKEKENLEARFTDFKNLMDEYHDGMLLFEISNREVWNKAGKDITGLENFFKQHKSKYKWKEKKYKGIVILCKDEEVKKRLEKFEKDLSFANVDAIVKEHFNTDSISDVKVIKGLFAKGNNAQVDQLCFKKEKNVILPEGFTCYYIKGKMLSSPESYIDVKGAIISDYQEELEKKWIESLREKYPVEIYWDVIETIIQK